MSKVSYCFECESWHAGEDHKMTRKADRERIATRSEARARLLEWLAPGSRVASLVRHVSRSGMQREISLFTATMADGKPEITCLDYWASRQGVVPAPLEVLAPHWCGPGDTPARGPARVTRWILVSRGLARREQYPSA